MTEEEFDWWRGLLNPYLRNWFSWELCKIYYDEDEWDDPERRKWIGVGIRKMIVS